MAETAVEFESKIPVGTTIKLHFLGSQLGLDTVQGVYNGFALPGLNRLICIGSSFASLHYVKEIERVSEPLSAQKRTETEFEFESKIPVGSTVRVHFDGSVINVDTYEGTYNGFFIRDIDRFMCLDNYFFHMQYIKFIQKIVVSKK